MIKNILLIDDDDANLYLLRKVALESKLVENVLHSSSVVEALDIIKDNNIPLPELILLDIEMPGLNGFDFLNSYYNLDKNITQSFSPKIVIVSGHLTADNFDKGKDYKSINVIDYLRKPIEKEDFFELVEENF